MLGTLNRHSLLVLEGGEHVLVLLMQSGLLMQVKLCQVRTGLF